VHVEHIKDKHNHPGLERRWSNFLLACGNCNSTKGTKPVLLNRMLLPDRDNTAFALRYAVNGRVSPRESLSEEQRRMAQALIDLVGLNDRKPYEEDRTDERNQARLIARRGRDRLTRKEADGAAVALREQIAETACETGFFSIWMDVFGEDPDMRSRFIDAFRGTSQSCFDATTTAPISPRPTNDLGGLAHAGKA
jgi:hypothetical protein